MLEAKGSQSCGWSSCSKFTLYETLKAYMTKEVQMDENILGILHSTKWVLFFHDLLDLCQVHHKEMGLTQN